MLMFSEQNTGFIYSSSCVLELELLVVKICDGDGHESFNMSSASVGTVASQYFSTVDTNISNEKGHHGLVGCVAGTYYIVGWSSTVKLWSKN